MVGVFRDHHVRDQARPRQSALDRQRRHRRLHDRFARPAAQLRPDVADHFEAGGDVFEHFALVLAEAAEGRAAAARAGAGRLVGDGLARQMFGQWLADRLASRAGFGRDAGVGFGGRVGRVGAGILGGDIFLEFADQQFELFDVLVELFRGPAEPCAAQHGQLHFQLFDVQCLGMDLGGVGGEFDVLAREFGLQLCGESAQRLRVGRERMVRQGHAKPYCGSRAHVKYH